MKPHMTWR